MRKFTSLLKRRPYIPIVLLLVLYLVVNASMADSSLGTRRSQELRCGIQVERRDISPLRGWQPMELATIDILPLRGSREFSGHLFRRRVAGGSRLKSGF